MNIEKWFKRFKAGKMEGNKTIIRTVKLKDGEPCNKICSFGEVCDLCNGNFCDSLIMEHLGVGYRHCLILLEKK